MPRIFDPSGWEAPDRSHLPSTIAQKIGNRVLEVIIRNAGGRMSIYAGALSGLSGDVHVHNDGEFIHVATADHISVGGTWNPQPLKTATQIRNDEEINRYVDDLLARIITINGGVAEDRRERIEMMNRAEEQPFKGSRPRKIMRGTDGEEETD